MFLRAGGFYRGIKPRGKTEWLYTTIKPDPASLLNDFKNIRGKACFNGVDNNDVFVNAGN